MTLSRHSQCAEALKDAIVNGFVLPEDITVQRVGSVLHYLSSMPEGQAGLIALIPGTVETERGDRHTDIDLVTIGVCVIGHVPQGQLEQLDAWDLLSEQLRDYLRRFRQIALDDGTAAMRVLTGLPTPWDADLLHRREVFISVIECVYQINAAIAVALPPEGPEPPEVDP